MIQGNQFFNQPPTQLQKAKWFPTIEMQLATINDIVESGPYVPKLTSDKLSTWELKARYTFYFKWGGPQVTDPTVNDPEKQGLYPTANTEQQAIQISNPKSQKPETIFHEWDIRRGKIKEAAFKRMFDNLSTSTDVTEITTQSPKKKDKDYYRVSKQKKRKRKRSKHVSTRSSKKIPTKKPKMSSSSSSSSTTSSNNSSTTSTHSSET